MNTPSSSKDSLAVELATQALEEFLDGGADVAELFSSRVLSAFVNLPPYLQERYLQRFRMVVPGFRVRGFLRAVTSYAVESGVVTASAPPRRVRSTADRPVIVVNDRQLADVVAEAVTALEALHATEATFFVRGGELVTLVRTELGTLVVRPLAARDVRLWLSQAADFVRRGARGDLSVSPPLEVAEGVLSLSAWSFPPLEAVVTAPVVRDDLTLLTEPGYDSATRLYYDPDPAFTGLQVPAEPTESDVTAALETLDDLLHDFPFARECDRANALALFLTPLLRPLLGAAPVPLAIIDAPVMGSGKSLLAKLVSVVATGSLAAMTSVPHHDEEWRKTLAGILLQGQTLVVFDNVEGELYAPQLAGVLTSERWSVRVLGTPRHVELVNRATWLVTGNNVAVKGDLARRCYRIRLDPGVEKPWQRTGWRHANLLEHAQAQRGKAVAALLTLVRWWASAGRPEFTGRTLGSFERWARTVGGVLSAANVRGFLDNVDEIYELLSDDAAEWRNFLATWFRLFRQDEQWSRGLSTHELVETLALTQYLGRELAPGVSAAEVTKAKELFDALPAELAATFRDGRFTGKERRVGKLLGHKVERVFGEEGYRLVKVVLNDNIRRWRVHVARPPQESKQLVDDEVPF